MIIKVTSPVDIRESIECEDGSRSEGEAKLRVAANVTKDIAGRLMSSCRGMEKLVQLANRI